MSGPTAGFTNSESASLNSVAARSASVQSLSVQQSTSSISTPPNTLAVAASVDLGSPDVSATVPGLLINASAVATVTMPTAAQLVAANNLGIGSSFDITVDNSDSAAILTLAVAALGGISLLVGGVGILTIMTIAVNQRTAEVGLLRALGARKRQILWLFVGEAVVLSTLALVHG